MLIAQKIGPGLSLDTYFTVIGFASALVGSVSSAATYLLHGSIRNYGVSRCQQAEIAGHGVVASAAAGIIVALTSAIIFVVIVLTDRGVLTINYDIFLVLLGWLCSLTSVLATSWGAVGNAHGRVIGAIMFGMLPPISMATYLICGDSLTVLGMVGAQLIGICVQAVGLAWLYRIHWSLLRFQPRVAANLIGKFPLAAAGTLCFTAYAAVDAWMAPSLGVGVMSHQSLAQRLVIAFSGIASAGPFMLASSITATMLDEDRVQDVWRYTSRSGIALTLICLIASAVTPWIGPSVIRVLFQRGEFGPSDTQAVVEMVSILLVGAGPMLASAIAFRVLHNKGCRWHVAILSLAWVAFYILFANALSSYFESLSLSIAYVLAWSVTAFLSYITLRKTLSSTFNR